MKQEKIIKNGKVAVAFSSGYGAGWVTWNSEISPFEPKVIKMILANKQGEINEEWCKKELGRENIYCGGAEDLKVKWLLIGTSFRIDEYDGSERITTEEDFSFTA